MARDDLTGPLVGRARELATLTAALARAAAGEPGAVLVGGDAGVGKTRLLTELVRHAERHAATVLVGHCLDLGGVGLPYVAFTEALQPLLDRRGMPAGSAGWTSDIDRGADAGQLQRFEAVHELLAVAGAGRAGAGRPGAAGPVAKRAATDSSGDEAPGPVVLILEDLQWADQSSRDLLAFLLTRLRDERLLVIGSYRTDDLHRRHPLRPVLAQLVRLPTVERLELAPFTDTEMRDYLQALQGGPVADGVAREIQDRSEGNAYYAQELLAARLEPAAMGAASTRSGSGTDAAVRGPLPRDLSDVLLARVERLSPDAARIVRVASVAGGRVGHELLAGASGLPAHDLEAALREAVTSIVLIADGDTYAFRHALLEEAVYADLLPGERVRLHAAYAQVLHDAMARGDSSPGSAAALAHHRLESHDVAGALAASMQAAEEAAGLRAPAEAWQHLEQVLRLWEAVGDADRLTGLDAVAVSLRAAWFASGAGELARAVSLADLAAGRVDAAADPARAASVQQKRAQHLLAADRVEAALESATEALRLASEAGDDASATTAWAAANAARALLALDRDDEARHLAERAHHDAVHCGSRGAEADALATLAAIDSAVGRTSTAADLLARARNAAEAARDFATELRVSYALAVERYDAGDLGAALTMLDAAVERSISTGLSWSVYGIELRALQVTARFVVGDWTGSARAAQQRAPRAPAPALARLAAASLYVGVARGEPAAAALVRHLDDQWHHDPGIALVAGACGAEALLWNGDPRAALAYAERATSYLAEAWAEPWFLGGIRLSALGLAAVGDLAEAARLHRDAAGEREATDAGRRLLDRARETAKRGRPRGGTLGPEGQAWLLRAGAEHARVEGVPGVRLWECTLEAFGYGHRYEQARSRWRLAAALLMADARSEAQEQARAAHREALDLGAVPLTAAVAALARRGRLDLGLGGSGAGPAATDLRLTTREREVLRLLAQGRTNRQIGEHLFIAEKTASVHVSNILGKLGASGRAEAVDLAHRTGLLTS